MLELIFLSYMSSVDHVVYCPDRFLCCVLIACHILSSPVPNTQILADPIFLFFLKLKTSMSETESVCLPEQGSLILQLLFISAHGPRVL